MSIILPNDLPATATLEMEGVQVIDATTFEQMGQPALRIGLVNLMPTKIDTETQFARLLARTPYSVELTLIVPESYNPKTTSAAYLKRFYKRWSEVKNETFDGLIITGAPVEQLPFENVSYWNELQMIMWWARQNVPSTHYICWAAQAALNLFRDIPKASLAEKKFGVYPHRRIDPTHPLMAGMPSTIAVPVSRHTETRRTDLPLDGSVRVLVDSMEAGLCLLDDPANRATYMFNHLEYDTDTLSAEYHRDKSAARTTTVPVNYYSCDNPDYLPFNSWVENANRLMANWVNLRAAQRDDLVNDLAA
jgi:homoserine O-succinyltransferase/O-acetyltransferase